MTGRWKVMKWACDECGRGSEKADHGRRDPMTCTPSCAKHGPMSFVGETPLHEFYPSTFASMSQRIADSWNAGYEHGREAVKTEIAIWGKPSC